MMNVAKLSQAMEERLSKKRYKHVINVKDCAVALAKRYHADIERVSIAALLHDCTKEESKEKQLQMIRESGILFSDILLKSPQLYHSVTGSMVAKEEFGVTQQEVIDAIRYHTTARAGMSKVEQIVYLADAISADRRYKEVGEFRTLANKSLDKAMFAVLQHTLTYLIEDGMLIPEDTMQAYHEYVEKTTKKSASSNR